MNHQMIKTDVCIIGAGPAGLTSAFHLAKAGISCTILDKDESPRTKTCGDILTSVSLRELRSLFPGFIDELPVSHKLDNSKGVIIHAPNYYHFQMDYLPEKGTDKPLCYSLKREDLDRFLVAKAKENPLINLIENFKVKDIERENGQVTVYENNRKRAVEAKMLIVAAGSTAPFAYKLTGEKKDDKHYAVGLRVYYKNAKLPKEGYGELFIRKEIPVGALYVTPFYDGMVNVNFAVRYDVVRKRKLNIKKLYTELMASDPQLQERFKDAEIVGKLEGSGLKLGTKTRKVSGDNFLLTGDSAGLIDIISANGLPQAFLSGRIAAEHTIKAFETNDFSAAALAAYDKAIFDRIKNFVKTGKMFSPLLGKVWYQQLSYRLLNVFAKYISTTDFFRNMLFDSHHKHNLLKPSFYLKAFLKSKNPESESQLV